MQLLTIAIPALERLAQNGEEGKKKIATITRIVTMVLALVTAIGYALTLVRPQYIGGKMQTLADYGELDVWFVVTVMTACFCAGAALVMWLAEKINEFGIGNGISVILFANIIVRLPVVYEDLIYNIAKASTTATLIIDIVWALLITAFLLALVYLIVWFTDSERRIPVQYAKRVVGRKMYGGQSSNLPLKLNMAGVMPVIFANSIVSIPQTLAMIWNTASADGYYTGIAAFAQYYFNYTKPAYVVLSILLLFAFAYFYIMISFNPVEVANNIRNNGGAVPGIRPGKPTSEYIRKILNRITFIGAVFLCVISELPKVIVAIFAGIAELSNLSDAPGAVVTAINNFYANGSSAFMTVAFAGTSVLIVVGVILETVRELESQLTMRNYKGFLD
jgi:preprotein translocase subunit SecY